MNKLDRKWLRIAAVGILTPVMGLGGCSQLQRELDKLNPEEEQGIVIGGGVGAAIGALIGSQAAGKGNRTEGAVIGGVLGLAIGGFFGKTAGQRVAERKAEYRTEREFLVAQANEAEQARVKTETLNAELVAEIDRLRTERDNYAARSDAAGAVRVGKKAEALDRKLGKVDDGLKKLVEIEEEAVRSTRDTTSPELERLGTEIEKLKRERDTLRQRRDELAKL